MTLVDAGPLVALADRDEVEHFSCTQVFSQLEKPMVTTGPVLTEAMYLLGDRLGWPAQERLWRLVTGDDLELAPSSRPELLRAYELMKKYRDIPMDFADASLVVAAESLNVTRVFTLDSDFRVYRMHTRKALEVIP